MLFKYACSSIPVFQRCWINNGSNLLLKNWYGRTILLLVISLRQLKTINCCLRLPKEGKDSISISSCLTLYQRLFPQVEFNFPFMFIHCYGGETKNYFYIFEFCELFLYMYVSYIWKGKMHLMQHKCIWTKASSRFITCIIFSC